MIALVWYCFCSRQVDFCGAGFGSAMIPRVDAGQLRSHELDQVVELRLPGDLLDQNTSGLGCCFMQK